MRLLILRVLQTKTTVPHLPTNSLINFGPFNFSAQRRWRKPENTAQTRLESRTGDLKLDRLMSRLRKLGVALHLFDLMSKRRGPFVSVQIMSRWAGVVGLRINVGEFLRKYPHFFEIFTHPLKSNLCCRVTSKMLDLVDEERVLTQERELENVRTLKKLLMMSKSGTLRIHALRLVRRKLGLPRDFRDSILQKYSNDFKLIDLEIVGLVDRDGGLATEEVEKWREKEYREKWLSEYETKYAFPINFPTGFKIEKGLKEKVKNWQRMPYVKPYENEIARSHTSGVIQRSEKRVVGTLHEFLSLTVEKMVEVERLAHFRRDLGIDFNVRELLLRHPGIFQISTKGDGQTVFLREAYNKDGLVEPNPIYVVRRKMLDLLLLGCRDTRELKSREATKEARRVVTDDSVKGSADSKRDGYPLFGDSDDTCHTPKEELNKSH